MLLRRINKASKWLNNPNNAGIISGIGFSSLHACIFSQSPSALIQGLGIASLALTLSISTIRIKYPDLNKSLSNRFNNSLEKIMAPTFDSAGFPLFTNGIFLGAVAAVAALQGDYLSSSISTAYFLANTDKGARISGNNKWTMENVGQKVFSKMHQYTNASIKNKFYEFSQTPPRAIKHTLYLPELWGSVGAGIYGFSHSGYAAAVGALSAAVAVTAAAINNGDIEKPAIQKIPGLNKIVSLSDQSNELTPSDQVISRRYMKLASLAYSFGAFASGRIVPGIGHGCAAGANWVLERADSTKQKQALNLG